MIVVACQERYWFHNICSMKFKRLACAVEELRLTLGQDKIYRKWIVYQNYEFVLAIIYTGQITVHHPLV